MPTELDRFRSASSHNGGIDALNEGTFAQDPYIADVMQLVVLPPQSVPSLLRFHPDL